MITAFGGGRGSGNQESVFASPIAITVSEERIYVADSLDNSVTVFSVTDFQ